MLPLAMVTSCIDDQGKFSFVAQDPSEELNFTNSFLNEYVLTVQTINNIAERFVWNTPAFGVETIVTYELQGPHSQGIASIVSTHDPILMGRADQVVELHDGKRV